MDATRPLTETRASGVQLHITSLPGGRLGQPARDFVDWLVEAGQSVWQVLPVSIPDKHRSPYKSPSAFAASPALLEQPDAPVSQQELDDFAAREAYWVDSWTSFGGDLADQVRFDREWSALRTYARDRGIKILGDVPIYVAPDAADERAWPQFFRYRRRGRLPARRVCRDRPAVGQPPLPLGRPARRRLRVVDRAASTHVRPVRPGPVGPLPRVRGLLGDPGRRRDRAGRAVGAGARAGGLRRGP